MDKGNGRSSLRIEARDGNRRPSPSAPAVQLRLVASHAEGGARRSPIPISTYGVQVPERRLVLAILHDAVAIFLRRETVPTTRGSRLFREVEGWFAADDPEWPFSFVNICAALDLDVERVRRALECARGPAPAAQGAR